MPAPHPPHPQGNLPHPGPGPGAPLLRKLDVAVRLNTSERTVDRLVHRGLLTRHRVGRRSIRFDGQEVDEYIRAAQDSMVDIA